MKDIEKYASSAKLALTGDEREALSARADALIESFAALDAIDVTGVKPLVSVLDIKNVLREDAAAKLVPREELLSAAPQRHGEYFRVPRTLD
ncbi:MAG: Asp-tRNA(Asn)/Glu-tRNA(Gln) amidotransferase subunit GatC [Oscillospiraceae bacterium]|nr:Asp-tRNA(Asn)/Glu-tRNA(Gln) amidotransferase subunit GatC [Oscillospiraceae bacterium]